MERVISALGAGILVAFAGFFVDKIISTPVSGGSMLSLKHDSPIMCLPATSEASNDEVYFVGCGGFF